MRSRALVLGSSSEQDGDHCSSGNEKQTQLVAALPWDTLQEGQDHISFRWGPQPWLPRIRALTAPPLLQT